jgi:predicted nucleic acid-binding protein
MNAQDALFEAIPRYCIDTNVIVSFLKGTDDEHYGADVFAPQWSLIERLCASGIIVAPRQVQTELAKWHEAAPAVAAWAVRHRYIFRNIDSDAQLAAAKTIVNAYPAYSRDFNYLGDLEVVTLAAALGITVITLETANARPSQRRPKIPDVCREFGIDCVSLPGFLRREGFTGL